MATGNQTQEMPVGYIQATNNVQPIRINTQNILSPEAIAWRNKENEMRSIFGEPLVEAPSVTSGGEVTYGQTTRTTRVPITRDNQASAAQVNDAYTQELANRNNQPLRLPGNMDYQNSGATYVDRAKEANQAMSDLFKRGANSIAESASRISASQAAQDAMFGAGTALRRLVKRSTGGIMTYADYLNL